MPSATICTRGVGVNGGGRGQRLSEEAARWRRRYRESQAALEEANRELLRPYLRERLLDPSDFDLLIGLDRVVDGSGRLSWKTVTALVDQLLEAKPHLGTQYQSAPWSPSGSAVQWIEAET